MRLPTAICVDNGRPGIDPEVTVWLIFASLLSGMVHNRTADRSNAYSLTIYCVTRPPSLRRKPVQDTREADEERVREFRQQRSRIKNNGAMACIATKSGLR